MQSTVSFPRSRRESLRETGSWISGRERGISTTNREVALEVHDLVYGTPSPTTTPTDSDVVLANLERLYEPNAVYKNPLITATSREMILDIHNLSRRMADVEVARPRALLAWLFGWGPRRNEPPWFEAIKCWSEIGDIIAESEGWDGTKRTVVEHTLHILLLPNLHVPSSSTTKPALSRSSSNHDLVMQPHHGSTSSLHHQYAHHYHNLHHHTHPLLSVRGFKLPSPFHLQLRIITKLTFNEQGRITAHRDFWDIRDLTGMIPGARAAQWVLTRLAARGLATASWFLGRSAAPSSTDSTDSNPNVDAAETEHTPWRSGASSAGGGRAGHDDVLNTLGLLGVRSKPSQAPDTDLDAMYH
ncbi:hypothetical protein CPB86DRAFT_869424 [Serendipita vermifera]|nr:hypothetical protein CPB86DRAFT_869424 [Serendipita vermifera]